MIVRSLVLAALALASAAPAAAQLEPEGPRLQPPAVSGQMSDADIARGLDAWLADLAAQDVFSGAVLVARDGREIFAGGYGMAEREASRPVDADTRFPLASIGKLFTAIAVAQLQQEGRLALDDRLGELVSDYPNEASRAATVGQLLNHQGGVADIFGPAFRDMPKERLASNHDYYALVSQQPPFFAPGERSEYCNGCYVVLGEIIARASGTSYEDYVARNILEPVGMTRSGFVRRDRRPDNTAVFYGHPRGPEGPLVDVSEFHGMAGSAAGNIYASARDLLALDNALRDHRLLNAELTAQVLRGEPEEGRATRRIGFAGGAPGVSTMLFGDGAWTLIVLVNREPPLAEAVAEVVFPLLAGPRPQ